LRRAVGIQTNTFGGATLGAMVDLVDQIRWEPFGGVSFYRLKMPDGSRAVTVDARLGDTTASLLPSTCGVDDGPEPAVDATGRPRALVVKRGASNFGFADRFSGERVFAARYRYEDAELVETNSCLLSGPEPLLEGRLYANGMLQYLNRGMAGYRPDSRWYGVPTSRMSATLIPWEEYQTVHLGPSLSPPPGWGPVLPMYREMFDVYNEATNEWGYTVESFDSLTPDAFEDPDFDGEDFTIGGRRRIHLGHLKLPEWLKAVRNDRTQLQFLLEKTQAVTAKRDGKLAELRQLIAAKAKSPTVNRDGKPNRKVIVFTAFADTARYLHEHLSNWSHAELGIHSGLICGDGGSSSRRQSARTVQPCPALHPERPRPRRAQEGVREAHVRL
jgi:hypothetical protein